MSKPKITFFCQHCGAQHPQWMGQCKQCLQWNSIVEEPVQTKADKKWIENKKNTVTKALRLDEIDPQTCARMNTQQVELNNVLGGGLVMGSVVLLGGEPGIGKSTLLLQIALKLPYKILYVSGEESPTQIKIRGERLNLKNPHCKILSTTETTTVFSNVSIEKPQVLIIDSIQTLQSPHMEASAGSVSQIKQVTNELIEFAKQTQTPVFIIGHINKDGHIAGPKVLEHMVDVVLYFEGDRNYNYRIIRVQKNRFGDTSALGIYEMSDGGLREVHNPSELLISKKNEPMSGTVIAASLEGNRPLMIEMQALVSSAVYGTPQRSTTGYPVKRLHMILAVLEKKVGFKLGAKDVFLNITGGLQIIDPAIDLSVVVAILSSNEDIPVAEDFCFAAEMGLTGEIRPVQRLEERISEADKLGFKKIFISAMYENPIKKAHNITIVPVLKITDLYQKLF